MRNFKFCLHFAALAMFLAGASGCLRPADGRHPSQDVAARTARAAVADYAHRLAASFEEAASRLEAGSLKSAAETNLHLQTSNAAARKQAFEPLDAVLNDALGGDKWDPAEAERLFQRIARGFRSVP